MNPLNLIRDNIRALKSYSTARDEFKGGDISVWLDANESPYDNGVNRYPDPHQKLLKRRISEIFGAPEGSIFLGGAGSDEAIDLTFRIFCEPGKDNAVAITPSYGVYRVAADINDIELREVLLNEDFSLPVERILQACDDKTKLIWICSPNNPTGNAFPKEDILGLADRFDGMVVVDEAYVDFSDKGAVLNDALRREKGNIIVLRTFSKAWGLAGMRCGMAFAVQEIAAYYDRVKYPYNMSVVIQKELLRRLEDDPKSRIQEIKTETKRMAEVLASIPLIRKVYPSDSNFILVKVDEPGVVYDYLVKHGVIVRNRDTMPLCKGCLRITVGTPAQNRLVESLLRDLSGLPRTEVEDSVEKIEVPSERSARISRKTSETEIFAEIDLDGKGKTEIDTGLKFFDHMLNQIPHHSGVSLQLIARGDLEVDEHHTMEDVAIVLGEVILKALGDKRGIERYGFVLPMDESDAMVLLDFGGRIDFQWDVNFTREYVGDTPTEMFSHFFQSLGSAMKCNLHVQAKGKNNHHMAEGVFKAFARALRAAVRREPGNFELPSSKGVL